MKIFQPLNKWFDTLPGAVRAGFWITCAGAFFTGMMSIARTLSPELSILVVVFFRASFGLMFLLPTAFANGGARLRTKKLSLYAIRGISAYLSVTFFFIAATYIPLGDIAAIGFTRPFLACIAAILILGELARSRRWIAIGIGIVGALIVIRPGFQEMNPGILFAITAVLLSVCNSIMIKYLSRTEHPGSIAIYQAVFVAPYALVVALFVWTTPLSSTVLGHFYTKYEKFNFVKTFGILIGFSGIVYLFSDNVVINENNFFSALLILLGATCYVIGGVLTLKISKKKNENVTGSILIWATIILIPIVSIIEQPWNVTPRLDSTISVIYLGLVSTGVAWLLRFKILKKNGLIFQSQVSYLIPIFGIILSYIFLKEIITSKILISLLAVLIGLYFVKKAK